MFCAQFNVQAKKYLENQSSAISSASVTVYVWKRFCYGGFWLYWYRVDTLQPMLILLGTCPWDVSEPFPWGTVGERQMHAQPPLSEATLSLFMLSGLFFLCSNLFTLDLIWNCVRERKGPLKRWSSWGTPKFSNLSKWHSHGKCVAPASACVTSLSDTSPLRTLLQWLPPLSPAPSVSPLPDLPH